MLPCLSNPFHWSWGLAIHGRQFQQITDLRKIRSTPNHVQCLGAITKEDMVKPRADYFVHVFFVQFPVTMFQFSLSCIKTFYPIINERAEDRPYKGKVTLEKEPPYIMDTWYTFLLKCCMYPHQLNSHHNSFSVHMGYTCEMQVKNHFKARDIFYRSHTLSSTHATSIRCNNNGYYLFMFV